MRSAFETTGAAKLRNELHGIVRTDTIVVQIRGLRHLSTYAHSVLTERLSVDHDRTTEVPKMLRTSGPRAKALLSPPP